MKTTVKQLALLTALCMYPIASLAISKISWQIDEVLNFVKPLLPDNPVIFEAGAYNGLDTRKMVEFWPKSFIYTFEPVPELYALLKKNTADLKNVRRFPLALSDKKGTAQFFISEYVYAPGTPSQSGSLLAPNEHLERSKEVVFPKHITVPTQTIDGWARENKVSHIDFMWLDMQGHELNALKHATHILPTVKLIYMEVEFVKAYKDQPLYNDVKAWLESKGFSVIALDFDESHALRESIPVGEGYFGNAIFINNAYTQSKK